MDEFLFIGPILSVSMNEVSFHTYYLCYQYFIFSEDKYEGLKYFWLIFKSNFIGWMEFYSSIIWRLCWYKFYFISLKNFWTIFKSFLQTGWIFIDGWNVFRYGEHAVIILSFNGRKIFRIWNIFEWWSKVVLKIWIFNKSDIDIFTI